MMFTGMMFIHMMFTGMIVAWIGEIVVTIRGSD